MALSSGLPPVQEGHATLQAIQVQVLLSLYYMDTGKMLRAGYYASAALSLANSSNLSCLGTSPTPSQDTIEQFERVRAFWTCLILSAHFISHGPTALKCPSQTLGSVTTPWPTVLTNDSVIVRFILFCVLMKIIIDVEFGSLKMKQSFKCTWRVMPTPLLPLRLSLPKALFCMYGQPTCVLRENVRIRHLNH